MHTHRGYRLDRPAHFLILDWERTERTEGGLRPRRESHGLRDETGYRRDPKPWSISPDGRWGVFWATGDLLDLRSFAEVKLSCIPDTTALHSWDANTCGTWLSPSSLVCSVLHKDGCSLIVVDIGQHIQEVETRAVRSVPTPYIFSPMEASANGSLVALYGDSRGSGNCIFLWDPTGDEIHLVKHAYNCGFCLSPCGDALYVAADSTWSVIPTSHSPITTAEPLHPYALKFSAARDTIMVATERPADDGGWEVGIFSRGLSSSPGTASVVSRQYFGRRFSPTAALTPDPHSMIFPEDDVVLHSMVSSSKIFPDRSRNSEHKGYPTRWWYAAMSSNLSFIVACGLTPNTPDSSDQELTFAVWDTETASLLYDFRTPQPSLRDVRVRVDREEIVVTDALDIYFVHGHRAFAYRHSDWSTSNPDEPRLLPVPELGPVPGEWFQIRDDGWVTRSDGHPEVGRRGRGREELFWIPPSQRVKQLWRGDQHLLAMMTEYDVIVLDLSDFDDDSKEQHVRPLQIENE